MSRCLPGDILLLLYPFSDGSGSKQRPALVLLDVGNSDVVVVQVTSQPARDQFDVSLDDWAGAGLRRPSVVRIHKIATIEKTLVLGKLGQLTGRDRASVRRALRGALSWIISDAT